MNTNIHDSLIESTDWLASRNQPVALVLTEILEPASGPESIIFPPTFARKGGDHPYAITELRKDNVSPEDAAKQGIESNICDLSTVGDQGNWMEPVFASGLPAKLVPQLVIKAKDAETNLLAIGHRVADGAVRYSGLNAASSEAIKALRIQRDAKPLAKLAPTSLIFGFWDSRESQLKSARILGSTIRATNVAPLRRSAQFNPTFTPEQMNVAAESVPEKTDKLSNQGLMHAPSVDTHGGVRVFGPIVRRTEINLVALRQLAAVIDGKIDTNETLKLRRYLLGLALVAARAQPSYNLRQGCLLVCKEKSPAVAEVVTPDGKRQSFDWNFEKEVKYAEAAAESFGVGTSNTFSFEPEKLAAALDADSAAKGKKGRARKVAAPEEPAS